MGYLKLYTREDIGELYPSAVAYSIHMAVSEDGNDYEPLNHGHGMLFPKATINSDNVIEEKGLINPVGFKRKCGGYGFFGTRVNPDRSVDHTADGCVCYFVSEDLVHFTDLNLATYDEIREQGYEGSFEEENDAFIMEVDEQDFDRLKALWMPIYNTAVECRESVVVAGPEDVKNIKVLAKYSDGSTHKKTVKWDDSAVDYNTPGTYEIYGVISQPEYTFPLAEGYADPIVFKYEGRWYYIATNDNTDDIGLFVRCADEIADLFAPDVKEYLILDYDEDRNLYQTFWAPEFHMIGDDLYILFAVGPKNWGPHSHMMKLKKGGNITNAEDWSDPILVTRADGSKIEKEGITLDMTYFKAGGKSYLAWSERYHIGSPMDSGSMIYLASIDENDPTHITSEPMLLTRPLYGWENQSGTINNEGPYPLVVGDKICIAYSGGSAGGTSYDVGLLTADMDADLLDINSWDKSLMPLLHAYSVEGEWGPGHNGFYKDDNGDTWITYHAKLTSGWATRSTAIRRVHFNVYGEPVFDMSKDRDVNPDLKKVSMSVIVK